MTRFPFIRDFYFWGLSIALLLLLAVFFVPRVALQKPVYSFVFVVDITRSMNVADYKIDGKPVSRLTFVKMAIRQALRELPCQSRIGLGLFTERQPTLLFEPIEVCENFNDIAEAVDQIDWRMAWAADSYVAKGVFRSVYMLRGLNANLVFFSDGQEAPPPNKNYLPQFEGKHGEVKGLVVGTGGYELSPIPKFNEDGEQTGFYEAGDVPHETRFGIPPKSFQQLEGWHERNAPFGRLEAKGKEHLSSVREDHLKKYAGLAGLDYLHLETVQDLGGALKTEAFAEIKTIDADIRWIPASAAIVLLLLLILITLFEALRWRIARSSTQSHDIVRDPI